MICICVSPALRLCTVALDTVTKRAARLAASLNPGYRGATAQMAVLFLFVIYRAAYMSSAAANPIQEGVAARRALLEAQPTRAWKTGTSAI